MADVPNHFDALVGAISALGGVVLGFGLNVANDWLKEQRSERKLLLALRDELQSNLSMFAMKQSIFQSTQQNILQNISGGRQALPFMRSTYDSNVVALSMKLGLAARNMLHIIYWRLELIDRAMMSPVSDSRDSDSVTKLYLAALSRQHGHQSLFEETAALIKAYLLGSSMEEHLAQNMK